ncbi:MAG: hypothetical protein HYR80_09200, partial [Nitrospirae bacterium]|nr:hypothetical protein [Nitrospirota bacterium]
MKIGKGSASGRFKIQLSSPENTRLSRLAWESLSEEESDLFTFEVQNESVNELEKPDLLVTISDQTDQPPRTISSNLRQVHWILPSGEREPELTDEIRLFLKEMVQTFRSPTTGN